MKEKPPPIAEKVKFWEEQDKINNALIPRFLDDHKQIVSLSDEMIKMSSEVTQSNLKISEIEKRLEEINQLVGDLIVSSKDLNRLPKKNTVVYLISVAAFVLSAIALILAII